MQLVQPEAFTFEAGQRAILLLHAFTGHTADVRGLGRFLEERNYTVHAPIYAGHGVAPEKLIETTSTDWWQTALQGYDHLNELGYTEIAVIGLSMGGLFSLKFAQTKDVKAVIPMATPMYFNNEDKLTYAFRQFAQQYKQLEQKEEAVIEKELDILMSNASKPIHSLQPLIADVKENLHKIDVPTLVVQPEKDQLIEVESASYIYDHIQSEQKGLKCYECSGHVITMGPEKDKLHADIYEFLQSLAWNDS